VVRVLRIKQWNKVLAVDLFQALRVAVIHYSEVLLVHMLHRVGEKANA
jgi:hypothetical protein